MSVKAEISVGFPPSVRREKVSIEVGEGVATCNVSDPNICRQRAEITGRLICNKVTLDGRSSDTVYVTLPGCATCGMVTQPSSASSQV